MVSILNESLIFIVFIYAYDLIGKICIYKWLLNRLEYGGVIIKVQANYQDKAGKKEVNPWREDQGFPEISRHLSWSLKD